MESLIPEIDLVGLDESEKEKLQLVEACKEWGCFRLINHRVPLPLMQQMKIVVRSLLDLPTDVKARNVDVIAGSGYVAPNKDNPLYEALGLYDVASTSAVDAFCTQLGASTAQREVIECYSRAVHGVMKGLAEKLAESMGVGRDAMKDWPCQFRINKYNFTDCTLLGTSGVCTHTDSGFLTLLQEDDSVGGLEVMHKSTGSFVTVHPSPGTFLINLGDVATAWSNNMFYNVEHRVQCKEAAVRVSIALFLLGPKEAPVEAPPEVLDNSSSGVVQPRLYAPFTYEDYRKLRLSTGLRAGEALQILRLDRAT